jgi:type IV secretion system protein TrbL
MDEAVDMALPNDLMVVFSDTISAGFAALQGPVNGIFGLMIVLVTALTGLNWILSPQRDILAGAFAKVLLVGAFAWLINDWRALAETVQAGFLEIGLAAGGGSLAPADFLNPGAILQTGWEIVKALGETPAPVANPLDVLGNLVDALILGLSMIGIMLAFTVLALQVIVVLLEFKIVTLAGFVLLPFGVWSRSAFLAERPLGYVVSAGLKVMALAIVVSGAQSVFDRLQPSANPTLHEALAILAATLLLAMLAIFIPNLAAALVTGGPTLGAGAAAAGGLAVAGGGALALGGGAAGGGLLARRAADGLNSLKALAGPAQRSGGAPFAPPPRPTDPPMPGSGPGPGPGPGAGPASGPASGLGAGGAPTPSRAPGSGGGAGTGGPPSEPTAPAAGGSSAARPGPASGRSAALQAFFTANAGRGLLPGYEASGSAAPHLKDEETR